MKLSVPVSRTLVHSLIFLWVLLLPFCARAVEPDYQSQYAKAQKLAKAGDDEAAARIYTALIKLDPKQPQAYNNLAVIKARHGELKEAQQLLQQALRSNPAYAAVYENLSAIYVEMARDSYGKALHLETPAKTVALRELNPPQKPVQLARAEAMSAEAKTPPAVDKNAVAKPPIEKPATIQSAELTAKPPGVSLPAAPVADSKPSEKTGAAVAAKPSPKPSAPVVVAQAEADTSKTTTTTTPPVPVKPLLASKPDTTPATTKPKPLTQASDAKATTAQAIPVVSVKPSVTGQPATVLAEVKPQSVPRASTSSMQRPDADSADTLMGPDMPAAAAADKADQAQAATFNPAEIVTMLQAWAAAWADKAVERYLGFYVADYAPAGMSHAQWLAQRRQRVQAPTWIHVSLSDIQVKPVQANTASVRLIQKYTANNYHDVTRKEIRLRQTPDGWRITEEKTLAKLR